MVRSTARPIRARAVVPPAGERDRGAGLLALKIGVSAGLLAYLLWRGDLAGIGAALRNADSRWVVVAVVLYSASHALNALRWQRYSRAFGFTAAPADFTRYYFAGLFVNLFMPGTIAGDLSRGMALGAPDGAGGAPRRTAALGSVVAHRLTGLAALLVLGGVAALVQRQVELPVTARLAAAVVPALAVALLLVGPSIVAGVAARVDKPVSMPSSWLAATAATLVAAGCYHALQIAAMMALARALDLGIAASTLGLFVPLVNAAGMVPVTLSGVGVREAGYVVLMGRIGVAEDQALALGLLGSLLVFAAGLLGAPAFFTSRPARSRRAPG